DAPAAAVEVSHDVADESGGNGHLEIHDRLEQRRAGGADGRLDALAAGRLERHLGRGDVVVLAGEAGHRDVGHRVASAKPAVAGLAPALLARGYELARDRAALDLVEEDHAAAARAGLDGQVADAELAAPARLLLVLALDVGDLAADGLQV